MAQAFELWDSKSANLVGSFESIDAAIGDLVARLAQSADIDWLPRIVLTLEDEERDEPILVARGREILELSTVSDTGRVASAGEGYFDLVMLPSIVGREVTGDSRLTGTENSAPLSELNAEVHGHDYRLAVAS